MAKKAPTLIFALPIKSPSSTEILWGRQALGNDPWCNGNTTDFGSVIYGSNPYGSTKEWTNRKLILVCPFYSSGIAFNTTQKIVNPDDK